MNTIPHPNRNRLTKKDLARARWGVSERTASRRIRKYGLVPADFTGLQALYDPDAVERMERRRADDLKARYIDAANGHAPHPARNILTVKQAKRLARWKGGAR